MNTFEYFRFLAVSAPIAALIAYSFGVFDKSSDVDIYGNYKKESVDRMQTETSKTIHRPLSSPAPSTVQLKSTFPEVWASSNK